MQYQTQIQKVKHKSDVADRAVAGIGFIYVYVTCGLSGLPVVSRLSFLSASAMAALLFIRKERLNIPPWMLWLFALYAYLIIPCLGMPVVTWSDITGATTILIGSICIGLVLVNNLLDPRYIAYAMVGAALSNVVAIILGIDTTPLEYGGANELRASGLVGNANVLAINLSLTAVVCWVTLRIPLSIRLISLFAAYYGIAVSGSRKGVILGAAILMIVLKRQTNSMSRFKQLFLLSIFLPVAIACWHYFDDALTIISDRVVAVGRITQIITGKEDSFSDRMAFIDSGLQMWAKAPLFGEGLGQFAHLSGYGLYSHNNYIELLTSGGIFALILYYTLYAMILCYAYKLHRSEFPYAMLIVTTMLVIDTAAVSFMARSTMLFITFALTYFSRGLEPNET